MSWTHYFWEGFFATAGVLGNLLIVAVVGLGFTVLVQVISGLRPQVSEYHLHAPDGDDEAQERNGHDRFPRN